MRTLAVPVAVVLAACGPAEETDATDTDIDSDTDTDTDTDSDTDTDTEPEHYGLLQLEGAAVVGAEYHGTEDVVFYADEADSEVICRVHLTLDSTAARSDCAPGCDWAFDVQITAAEALVTTECDAIGWADPAAAVGTVRAYGYTPDYYGHAPAILSFDGTDWAPLSYAYWDSGTGELTYTQSEGYRPW